MNQQSMKVAPPDYPAGEYVPESNPSAQRRSELIADIEQLPAALRQLVAGLDAEQLDTKYKNWTVRQIVHHLADSHVNAYVRIKLTLTEDRPTIKPYDESRWSQLSDATTLDVEPSFRLLEGVHARWVAALRAMSPADFERAYFHPEYKRLIPLAEFIGLYAWHGRHHSQMISWLRVQHGWK